jgi:hypothetical protein
MAFDELKSQSYTDYVGENMDLIDEVHDSFIKENSSGLIPLVSDITDICSDLFEKIQDFVKLHNSLKDYEPDADTICDAGYSFHKIAFMLSECIKELNETDTSWYHQNNAVPMEIENSNNENIE